MRRVLGKAEGLEVVVIVGVEVSGRVLAEAQEHGLHAIFILDSQGLRKLWQGGKRMMGWYKASLQKSRGGHGALLTGASACACHANSLKAP